MRRFAILTTIVILTLTMSLLAGTKPEEYAARRNALAKKIGPDGMLILLSPPAPQRNGDVDWPFRQEDSILYLTGIAEPETNLVIVPGESDHSEIVFSRDHDPLHEVWNGRIPSFDEVSSLSGVKEVVSVSRFRTFLQAAMEGRSWGDTKVYRSYRTAGLPGWKQKVRSGTAVVWMIMENRGFGTATTPELALVSELRQSYPELQFRDAFPLLTSMRLIKSPSEIATIQRAIDITVSAQKEGMLRGKSAKFEYEVQATIEHTFRNLGACCWGFPSIVASGRNATTLHYVTNNDPITPGSLVLADIGAEVDGYTADVTRTWPQDGTFDPTQRAIYQAVLRAQSETIPRMKPGVFMREVHETAISILGEDLLRLGLITRNESAQVRMYFIHGLGHQLGLRVHDVVDNSRKLEAGMIVSNEPGIYVRSADVHASETFLALSSEDKAKIDEALKTYDGIGVRIEDDILITSGAPVNLSGGAPRTIEEIERFMASN